MRILPSGDHRSPPPWRGFLCGAWLVWAVLVGPLAAQTLPPPPEPKENPTTAEKAILGKMLFWEEQLSSDRSMACGTCHRPALGGTDPRARRHPGPDGEMLTKDDVVGSPGIARDDEAEDEGEDSILDDLLGTKKRHMTARAPASNLTAQYAPDLFWDGRARGEFRDPLTGKVVIAKGGALESQALEPIMNTAEMSRGTRSWQQVIKDLEVARPMHLATNLPPDVAAVLEEHPTYPKLFARAFGDPTITPTRIAFALAAYQRTLVPDQTPYDKFVAGDSTALTDNQKEGLDYFRRFRCATCHTPPLFTDNSFRSIGLRPNQEDTGRGAVTGDKADEGKFKVPSLRNVGLRKRFMHNGRFASVTETLRVYRFPNRFPNLDPILQRGLLVNHRANEKTPMLDFLLHALTDPRVAAESHPFDRPRLRSERGPGAGSAAKK